MIIYSEISSLPNLYKFRRQITEIIKETKTWKMKIVEFILFNSPINKTPKIHNVRMIREIIVLRNTVETILELTRLERVEFDIFSSIRIISNEINTYK